MNQLPIRRSFSSEIDLFGIFAISLVAYYHAIALATYPELKISLPAIILAMSAAAGSSVLLLFLGYFKPFRFIPRKTDIFLVSLSMVSSALLFFGFYNLFFDFSFLPLNKMIGYTFIFSIVVFFVHYFLNLYLLKKHRKRVILKLTAEEEIDVKREFAGFEIDKYIDFVSLYDDEYPVIFDEIDLIIISRAAVRNMNKNQFLLEAHLAGVPVVDRRRLLTELSGRVRLVETDMWNYMNAAKPQNFLSRTFFKLKFFFEPIIALFMLIVLSPLFLIVGTLIKITSPGPVFYRQLRVGYRGKEFTLIKFRSMRIDSESSGHKWASQNDDRVTKLGKFFRKARIDELPQLINVIRGEMSFIGPRPERPEFYAELEKEIPLFPLRNYARPGITGWAQVRAGYAASVEESKLKLEYDLYYIQHMSPRLDFITAFKTIQVIFMGSEYKNNKEALATSKLLSDGKLNISKKRAIDGLKPRDRQTQPGLRRADLRLAKPNKDKEKKQDQPIQDLS